MMAGMLYDYERADLLNEEALTLVSPSDDPSIAGVALAMLAFPYFDSPALWCVLVGILAGASPGALMALLPKALPKAALAPGFGVYYTVFYLSMAAMPGLAGGLRDRYASPAAPLFFAAALMAAVVLALVAFRAVAHTPSTARA